MGQHWLVGWARGWLITLAALAAFALLVGIPHIRISYEYRGRSASPVYVSCTYLGPLGRVSARPGHDVGRDCPVIAFF